MYFRTVKSKGKQFGQFVESYRDNGVVKKRVVAGIGEVSDVEAANIKAGIRAARKKQRVVALKDVASLMARRPLDNLRYLDAAVLLELLRDCGLLDALQTVMDRGSSKLPASAVVAAMVIQRCLEPDSKLAAARWVPKTALPELLGASPDAFNNSRFHRVLTALDKHRESVMARLPHRHAERDGRFTTLFVDVTDTWFVGDGPAAAKRGKTKEGLIRKKIGIVLMCNERGYPVRWKVIAGDQSEFCTLPQIYKEVGRLPWAQQATVVCDRAMGTSAGLRELHDSGLSFLTAMCRTEFEAFTPDLPWRDFIGLSPDDDETAFADQIEKVASTTSMHKITDDLWVRDFGVVERSTKRLHPVQSIRDDDDEDALAAAISKGKAIIEAVQTGVAPSLNEAGRRLGLSVGTTKLRVKLARLPQPILDDIEQRGSAGLSIWALRKIAALRSVESQISAYFEAREHQTSRHTSPQRKPRAKRAHAKSPVKVRAVAYFNPEIFTAQRRNAQALLARTKTYLANLAVRANNYTTPHRVAAAAIAYLRKNGLVTAFNVNAARDEAGAIVFKAKLNQQEWDKRRRYDGFSLLVAHHDTKLTAVQLCQTYRAKNLVEQDFGVIKSMIQLRPIRHQTDAKVRAHVEICMFALTLERHLNNKLGSKGPSAMAALETFESCRLNRYGDNTQLSSYLLTKPTKRQNALLRKLNLQHLVDDIMVSDCTTPRTVTTE